MVEPAQASRKGFAALVRRHPVLSALLLLCSVLGAVLGATFLPQEWALARRIAAGAVSGAGCWLLVTFARLYE